MKKSNHILINFLVLSPIGIVLSLYAHIGSFNRLLGDSLCSFYYAERLGLFRSIWYWRITWSGRYSAYAFDWLTTKFFDSQNIIWFTPLVIAFWILISITTFQLLLKSNFLDKNNVYLPALLGPASVFLILITIPNIEQSFYWLDGFRAYTLPFIILITYQMLYFVFIEKINSKLSVIFASGLSFFLFFASGGLSETFATFQFCLVAFGIIYYWVIERPKKFDKNLLLLAFCLLGSLLAVLVVASAPGNEIRQRFFPPPPNLLNLVGISVGGYIDFLSIILFSPEKITTVIGVSFLSGWAGSIYKGQINQHKNKIILQTTGAILLSFACFPPGVYGYSEPPPNRVLSIAIFIISIFLISVSFLIGNLLTQKTMKFKSYTNVFLVIAVLFISVGAWLNVNILSQTKIVFIEYAQKWDATDLLIKQAIVDGKDVVEIPADPSWAGMDLPNQNPKHWVNECYSFFYGIQVFGPPR